MFPTPRMDFNPRLRKGDDVKKYRQDNTGNISIHVSARETTALTLPFASTFFYFNPRLRKGDDEVIVWRMYQ